MAKFTIEILGNPVATQRVRFNGKRGYKAQKTRLAMNRRIMLLKRFKAQHSLDTITDPVFIEIDFFHDRPQRLLTKKSSKNELWKTTKPDIDNLTKLILDCLTQAEIIKDDSLVVQQTVRDKWVGLTKEGEAKPAKSVILIETLVNKEKK